MDPKLLVFEKKHLLLMMDDGVTSSRKYSNVTYTNPLFNLPTHVLLHICSFLNHKELIILSKLSTQTNKFIKDPANGVWSNLTITNRDDNLFFTLENIMKCGKPVLDCINELVLDQTTCRSFKDGAAFSSAIRWVCKHMVNMRKLTLEWCGTLLNSALVDLGKGCRDSEGNLQDGTCNPCQHHLYHLQLSFHLAYHILLEGSQLQHLSMAFNSILITSFKNISERGIQEFITRSKSLRQLSIKGCGCMESASISHLRQLFGHININPSPFSVTNRPVDVNVDTDSDDTDVETGSDIETSRGSMPTPPSLRTRANTMRLVVNTDSATSNGDGLRWKRDRASSTTITNGGENESEKEDEVGLEGRPVIKRARTSSPAVGSDNDAVQASCDAIARLGDNDEDEDDEDEDDEDYKVSEDEDNGDDDEEGEEEDEGEDEEKEGYDNNDEDKNSEDDEEEENDDSDDNEEEEKLDKKVKVRKKQCEGGEEEDYEVGVSKEETEGAGQDSKEDVVTKMQ